VVVLALVLSSSLPGTAGDACLVRRLVRDARAT
jgi:hypothetical protein